MKTLPPFIDEMLAAPPRAGEGVHHWLFRVARQLHAHLPAGEIVALLESRVQVAGVTSAGRKSMTPCKIPCRAHGNRTATPRRFNPPRNGRTVNQEQREAIMRDGGGLADLWECPSRALRTTPHTRKKSLTGFFPAIRFCVAASPIPIFDTKPREDWRGELSALALIVPSPMSAVEGMTKDGKRIETHARPTPARGVF